MITRCSSDCETLGKPFFVDVELMCNEEIESRERFTSLVTASQVDQHLSVYVTLPVLLRDVLHKKFSTYCTLM